MTKEEIYGALVLGFEDIGMEAHHRTVPHPSGTTGHILTVRRNGHEFQIFIDFGFPNDRKNCVKRVGKMCPMHACPDLADPLYFEKVRGIIDEHYPSKRPGETL